MKCKVCCNRETNAANEPVCSKTGCIIPYSDNNKRCKLNNDKKASRRKHTL